MTFASHDGMTRRGVLQAGMLSGLSLSRYLALAEGSAAPRPRADNCIFIHLQGGPSHLDTLDMKPEPPAAERGEFASIATRTAGYRVCEHLPRFAQAVDRFCVVRGMSHSAGAHPQADAYLFTGNRPTPAIDYPGLGSVLARER